MSITQRGRNFKKGIVFPLLYEVSEKCKDEYWKQFFLDLSIGKSIRDVRVSNRQICCTNKKKSFEYYFADKNSEEIVNELIPILVSNFITCSEKHIKIKNISDQVKHEIEELKNGKWSQIRRKNLKLSLLMDYVKTLQSDHKLNWNDCINLYEVLSSNFNSHVMTKLINMENGKISRIEGIEIEDSKLVFNHNFYTSEKNYDVTEYTSPEEEKEESFANLWNSYVKRYFKNIRATLT